MNILEPEDQTLCDNFLRDGYVILPAEDGFVLADIAKAVLRSAYGNHVTLDDYHTVVTPENLNDNRLRIYRAINAIDWTRPAYYRLAQHALDVLVGNELAMQKRINLSIQLPGDSSSLLPLHADVWQGDSPYEVVLWVPLVDCYRTKSMFIVHPEYQGLQDEMHRFASTEEFYQAALKAGAVTFLDIPYGNVLIFSQNLMHGNRINEESTTRWSLNCRFKSLMSPYADKKLGEFFEPITVKPATMMGVGYRLPVIGHG